MKVGDKVRFLSEVGGGVVTGFLGKDLVLVEDADGFEIPMLKTQVVVIDTDDYNIAKVNTREPVASTKKAVQEPIETEPADKPVTFKAKPLERKDGDKLNLYLCFVPNEVKEISTTTFEAYFVNDSNYYMQILYLTAEGAAWHARFQAIIEPNSKLFVEEFDRSVLNDFERVCIQTVAWKQDKTFQLKPALSTELRIDVTKFYKLHVFRPNEFFRDPNWCVDVIRDDRPVRSVFVNAEQLQEALMDKKKADERPVAPAAPSKKEKKPDVIEVDLHIHELLDNTSGLSNGDMLMAQMNEFRKVMDENIKKKGQKIVFIHGKGEGVLRKTILQELKYRYKNCSWQDASFREYGFGATLVKVN